MRVHFIAIGGSAMHNLAIALHMKGYNVSGSDDEIFEPSKSRLTKNGLLPENEGWYPEKITTDIDAIILGMHARENNPELIRAKELGLKIYSYPEYLYEQSIDKTRVVVGGSHGKTTTTSLIMHVLKSCDIDFDYMVGAQLPGFETMVKLSETAKVIILEGDEYLSSPIDRRPKFHLYKPHIAVLTGIAWDHINVFPDYNDYVDQFRIFIDTIVDGGTLFYCDDEKPVQEVVIKSKNTLEKIPYNRHNAINKNGITYLQSHNGETPIEIFGEHNLKNINAAKMVCNKIGITDNEFYRAISSFTGAAKRLQLLGSNDNTTVFLDFAHSPSKLAATSQAVKAQFPERELAACMELHTFSSLNKKFLNHYGGTMDSVDFPVIYYNPHTIEHKRLENIEPEEVKSAFNNNNLKVYTDSTKLIKDLLSINWNGKNLLMMSSGNFNGIDFNEFANKILK